MTFPLTEPTLVDLLRAARAQDPYGFSLAHLPDEVKTELRSVLWSFAHSLDSGPSPNPLKLNFQATFGKVETERAALRIVTLCHEKKDWTRMVYYDSMIGEAEKNGFLILLQCDNFLQTVGHRKGHFYVTPEFAKIVKAPMLAAGIDCTGWRFMDLDLFMEQMTPKPPVTP